MVHFGLTLYIGTGLSITIWQLFEYCIISKKQVMNSEDLREASGPIKKRIEPGFTNHVIVQKDSKKNHYVYYVPSYLRMKVKNFTEVNLQSLKAQINTTLIFSVFYGNMPKVVVEHLIQNVDFHFGRDDAIKLNEGLQITLKHKKSEKMFTYTVRRVFKARIDSDVFWTPFQVVNLVLTITIHSTSFQVTEDDFNGIKVEREGKRPMVTGEIKFNLMDCDDRFLKTSYSEQGRFGNYDLAEALMRAEYSNDRIPVEMKVQIDNERINRIVQKNRKNYLKSKKVLLTDEKPTRKQSFGVYLSKRTKQNLADVIEFAKMISGIQSKGDIEEIRHQHQTRIRHFQYAHFTIPLYRLPQSTIVTIFLPLWLLGIINLGIFFQNNDLAGRIASLATLMIAFVSLIGTIRQQIPPSPKITMVQILVYMQTLTSFLGFIDSLLIRNVKKFKFIWYKDALFVISLLITLFTIVIVLVIYAKHKFVWEPSYNKYQDEEEQVKFNPHKWRNDLCDKHFAHFVKDFQIMPNPVQELKKGEKKSDKEKDMRSEGPKLSNLLANLIQNKKDN